MFKCVKLNLFLFCLLLHINSIINFNFNDILIKKPYETVCDETTTTQEPDFVDQHSEECPLEYKSSSLKTGCLCNFKTLTIDCIYSNRLDTIPKLYKTSKIEWNLNLKCKNFTHLNNLRAFLPLSKINILDLSSYSNPQNTCRIFNNQTLMNLNRIGSTSPVTDLDTNKIFINEFNLESNHLSSINLVNNTSYDLKIKNLRLSNNNLESLDIKTELDLCYLKIENLNVSNNRLKHIELGYLMFVKRLNLSQNHLTLFLIDFYDTKDFRQYYSQSCKFDNSTSLHSALVDFDISINFLSSLPFNLLNIKYFELIKLNVSSNQIREIRNYEFSNMPNLERLDLSSNMILTVVNKSFYGLTKLKYLDLSFNFIHVMPKNIFFEQKESLESLNLNHNNLTEVPKESFKYLGHVKYLYLCQNRIEEIRNFSFGFMFNLIELYLSENQIHTIQLNAFFIDEQSYYGPGLIEKLDLSFNKLTHLAEPLFSYLTNLRYLILNNNRLKSIDPSAFMGVNYLISLDLRLNLLSNLSFLSTKNFSNLRYLRLSDNKIEFLRPGQFINLKSLNYLDLSGNQIKFINSCAFYGLQNTIRKLFLNYNQINRLNTCAFTMAFKHLRFVQIMHNPLNCTNNCEFFFTVYNPPYSINYQGVECVNNTLTSVKECSKKQYDRIYNRCKMEAQANDCALLANDENLNYQSIQNVEYDYSEEKSLIMQDETNDGQKFSNVNFILIFVNVKIFIFLKYF